MSGQQTAQQRQASVTDAGYSPAQQGQVFAGQQTTAPVNTVLNTSGTGVPAPITFNLDSVNNPPTLASVPSTLAVPGGDYYKSVIAGIPTIASITGALSPDQNTDKTTQQSLQDKILGVIQSISGKSAAQTTAEANAGIPDITKNLTDVTAQMTALKNEADAIPLQTEQDSAGLNRTAGGVAPLNAAALRQNAIKQLGLSTIAATLQGNLALAQQQADKAVAVQFDPLQSELDYLKQALSMNADTLSEADKEQQTTITSKLQERQNALDQARSDYQSVQTQVITATQNGAPAAIVSQALALPPTQAAALLAPYLKAKVKPDLINVAPGTTVFDPATGKPIYTAPAKATTDTTPKIFTQTQLNSGAANAGLPIANFKTLDADSQNWFINNFGIFTAQQKLIASGQKTKEEVASDIQSSTTLSDTVKRTLLALLDVSATDAKVAPSSGGILNGVKNWLGSWTGINF